VGGGVGVRYMVWVVVPGCGGGVRYMVWWWCQGVVVVLDTWCGGGARVWWWC
jgi:hypothetical protein